MQKKTGEIRLCMDYRKLNSITVRDAFPLPRIDEALQAVHSSNWFTSFDLAQGYLQLAMEESDIKKTAFRAGSTGLYEFTHMPFGLSNAGSSFCRLMEQCLGDQQFVTLLLYLDDISIFAPTIDEMLDRIQLVFNRLKQFNLKIKPKKCQFFSTSVLFLGHVLSAEAISANPEKVDKVKTWPVPKTIKEVQSFLGLASYYRRFIPHFAKKARCLHELVGPTASKPKNRSKARVKETKAAECEPTITDIKTFEWTIEHQEAFDALKEALCTAPVLGYPDFTRDFILETDASLKGLGTVLSQQQKDGSVHVIAYASQSLRPSERSMRNYSSAKLELLALKWAITEKFRDYLLGSRFQVYTDNNPLAYIQESKLGASQIRWLSELALFDFTIKYQTGHSNRAADALSHRPFNPSCDFETESTDSDEVEVISYSATSNEVETIPYSVVCEALDQCLNGSKIPEVLKQEAQDISCAVQTIVEEEDKLYEEELKEVVSEINAVSIFGNISPEDMKEEQQKDPILGLVYKYVTASEKPKTSAITKIKSKAVRKYLLQFERLTLKKGVLHRLYINNDVKYHQMVLPLKYQAQVLKLLHDGQGHQGLERTLALCWERFYWNTMFQDVSEYVKTCPRCQTAKGDYTDPKTKPGSIIANNPMDLLCIDFTKVDPSKSSKENILVLTDAFSKFSQAFVTPNQKALTVAKILVDKWFYVYGIPARIHSDQGWSFDNQIMQHLYALYGIEQSTTMPYNPRGNAYCERFNRTMIGLLTSLSKEQKDNWPLHLPSLVFAYNAMPHSTTGYQPYELMFGRKAPTICDAWLKLAEYNDKFSQSKCEWVNQQHELILAANRRALKRIKQSAEKSVSRARGKDLKIPMGNLVLLHDHPEG